MNLPPEVERFFADQRRKQQMHNTIAVTQRNLKETADTLGALMDKATQRGVELEAREEQAEELLDSSEEFHLAVMPGWKRYIYTWKAPWWFFVCCCFTKKRKRGKINGDFNVVYLKN